MIDNLRGEQHKILSIRQIESISDMVDLHAKGTVTHHQSTRLCYQAGTQCAGAACCWLQLRENKHGKVMNM
jgi:hypothetical protein